MKNILLFTYLLAAILLSGPNTHAQMFKGEVIGGFNKSQVDGDEVYGFKKYGLVGGFGVVMPIRNNWSLSLETLYSQKGSKQAVRYADSADDGSYRLRLNYTEVPFMIQYTDRQIASAGIGVSWNRLVFVDEYRNGRKVDSVSVLTKVFDRNDWIGFADLRLRLYKNFILNARYSYSLKKIATRTVNDSMTGRPNVRDWYNNLWSFRVIYMINETPPERSPKKKRVVEE